MTTETQSVLRQIDTVIAAAQSVQQVTRQVPQAITNSWLRGGPQERPARSYTVPDAADVARANALIHSALKRYSPPGSPHVQQAEAALAGRSPGDDRTREHLLGILRALRFEYENGLLESITELVHADLFADILAMAEHLLSKAYKDAAAVLASGVFEQHLRHIAKARGVSLVKDSGEPRSADGINADLHKAGAYDGATQKHITAHLALRNHAAHAKWTEYDAKDVTHMIEWVRLFLQKHPT